MADGVDLTAPEATFVRAFAEAKRLALAVGTDLSYPGFSDAVSDVDWLHIPYGGAYPSGAAQGDWKLRWAGTFRARILQIQPRPDGFAAAYCLDFGAVAESEDGGATYRWARTGDAGEPQRGWTTWLTARSVPATHTSQTQSPIRESLDRAPRYNSFDGWLVTDAWGPSARTPTDTVLSDACTTWTQKNEEADGRQPGTPANPPPVSQTPFPGWPGRPRE
ncbi:hypothetical protein [Nocardia sp. NBC_01327]|uniref:hypothetical protein n=1 Tax=Nocardia sp. NBC_01327 TaxID=2903593 RepID=UPI002E0FF049|nr:hypothetical protein OG326_21230 [Nocardia sp. NBC_01327]